MALLGDDMNFAYPIGKTGRVTPAPAMTFRDLFSNLDHWDKPWPYRMIDPPTENVDPRVKSRADYVPEVWATALGYTLPMEVSEIEADLPLAIETSYNFV